MNSGAGRVSGLPAAGLFAAVTGGAMLFGHGGAVLNREDYLRLIPTAQAVGHPRGSRPRAW